MATNLPADENVEHPVITLALNVATPEVLREAIRALLKEKEQLRLDLAQQTANASTIIEMQVELGKLKTDNERLRAENARLHHERAEDVDRMERAAECIERLNAECNRLAGLHADVGGDRK